jgi:hypothetical protein
MNTMESTKTDIKTGQISLHVRGLKNPISNSPEVCILSFVPWQEDLPEVPARNVEMQGEWISDDQLRCNDKLLIGAMKSMNGEVNFPDTLYRTINVLSHPYSGILEISWEGETVAELDLYSSTTIARSLHLDKLIPQLRHPESISSPLIRNPHLDKVVIRATGRRNPHSKQTEVFLLGIQPNFLDEEYVYLHEIDLPEGWLAVHDVNCGGSIRHGALKSTGGTLSLPIRGPAVIEFLSHPYSGIVEVEYVGQVKSIDLYSGTTFVKRIDLDSLFSNLPYERRQLARSAQQDQVLEISCQVVEESTADNPFHAVTVNALAVTTPRWKGVTAATKNLFSKVLLVPESPDHHPDQVNDFLINLAVTKIIESKLPIVVFSGAELFYLEIARRVRKRKPSVHFFNIWHSNYLQTGEEHDWRLFREWLNANKTEGLITRIAVVRKGYESYLQRLGYDVCFIPNCLPTPLEQIVPTSNRDTVGIWLSGSSEYRKHPEVMIIAASMIPNLRLKISGTTPRITDLLAENEIEVLKFFPKPIPAEQMFAEMKSTALSLYVTASECSPMIPLESFAIGVPCIVGANSHLYEGNDLLSKYLIVENIGSPSEIAERIRSAMQVIPELVHEFQSYNKEITKIAETNLVDFLRL